MDPAPQRPDTQREIVRLSRVHVAEYRRGWRVVCAADDVSQVECFDRMAHGRCGQWHSEGKHRCRVLVVDVLLWSPVRRGSRAVVPLPAQLIVVVVSVPGRDFGCLAPSGPGSLALRGWRLQTQGLSAIGLLPVPGCRLDAVRHCRVGEAPEVHCLLAPRDLLLDGLKALWICQY